VLTGYVVRMRHTNDSRALHGLPWALQPSFRRVVQVPEDSRPGFRHGLKILGDDVLAMPARLANSAAFPDDPGTGRAQCESREGADRRGRGRGRSTPIAARTCVG
jgi:hypothetical protein